MSLLLCGVRRALEGGTSASSPGLWHQHEARAAEGRKFLPGSTHSGREVGSGAPTCRQHGQQRLNPGAEIRG